MMTYAQDIEPSLSHGSLAVTFAADRRHDKISIHDIKKSVIGLHRLHFATHGMHHVMVMMAVAGVVVMKQ